MQILLLGKTHIFILKIFAWTVKDACIFSKFFGFILRFPSGLTYEKTISAIALYIEIQ